MDSFERENLVKFFNFNNNSDFYRLNEQVQILKNILDVARSDFETAKINYEYENTRLERLETRIVEKIRHVVGQEPSTPPHQQQPNELAQDEQDILPQSFEIHSSPPAEVSSVKGKEKVLFFYKRDRHGFESDSDDEEMVSEWRRGWQASKRVKNNLKNDDNHLESEKVHENVARLNEMVKLFKKDGVKIGRKKLVQFCKHLHVVNYSHLRSNSVKLAVLMNDQIDFIENRLAKCNKILNFSRERLETENLNRLKKMAEILYIFGWKSKMKGLKEHDARFVLINLIEDAKIFVSSDCNENDEDDDDF